MEYYDVSQTVVPSHTLRRTYERRGIVLHELRSDLGLPFLAGNASLVGKPKSSDFYVNKEGSIYQLTKQGFAAYHTGTARWRLYQEYDYTINQGFYGITVEWDRESLARWTEQQYRSVAWLIRRLISAQDIAVVDIIGNYQCALPVGRAKDPVGMDWAYLTQELIRPSDIGYQLPKGVVLP